MEEVFYVYSKMEEIEDLVFKLNMGIYFKLFGVIEEVCVFVC